MADVAVAHFAATAILPLAANVLGAPLPHAREIGHEVVDGFRGRMDFDTGFTMHTMDSHESSPRYERSYRLRRPLWCPAIVTSVGPVVQGKFAKKGFKEQMVTTIELYDIDKSTHKLQHLYPAGT